MKYETDEKQPFGHLCDALTATGERCKCTNQSVEPCYVAQGKLGRSVRLCRVHAARRARARWDRLPLIEGGFLGGYNRYGFGSMVTAERRIDWERPGLVLEIPAYWGAPS